LRKLKKSSPVITDVLKSLMNLSSVNAVSGIEKLCPWLLQISYKKNELIRPFNLYFRQSCGTAPKWLR
jgi:hypothetical protein